MKNNLKKMLSVFLCVVLIFTTASTAFAADETRTVVDSGFCGAQGENLMWTLYADGELVISGEGEMAWYFVDYDGKEPDVDVPPRHIYTPTVQMREMSIRIIQIVLIISSSLQNTFYAEMICPCHKRKNYTLFVL